MLPNEERAITDSEDENQSTQIQPLKDKPKECQDEQLLKSPRKCTHYNSQSHEEH